MLSPYYHAVYKYGRIWTRCGINGSRTICDIVLLKILLKFHKEFSGYVKDELRAFSLHVAPCCWSTCRTTSSRGAWQWAGRRRSSSRWRSSAGPTRGTRCCTARTGTQLTTSPSSPTCRAARWTPPGPPDTHSRPRETSTITSWKSVYNCIFCSEQNDYVQSMTWYLTAAQMFDEVVFKRSPPYSQVLWPDHCVQVSPAKHAT